MGWPGPLSPQAGIENPVKTLLEKAQTNIAVLLTRDLGQIRKILVPLGGGGDAAATDGATIRGVPNWHWRNSVNCSAP